MFVDWGWLEKVSIWNRWAIQMDDVFHVIKMLSISSWECRRVSFVGIVK